jgi:hypothetical protein
MRIIAGLLLAAFTAAAQSPAQNWNNVTAVPAGTEVRIAAGSRTVLGQVQSATADSFVVVSGKGQEMFTRQEVTRVSIRTKGHRGRNALIGLGVGAGVGLGVGAAWDNTGDCHSIAPCSLGHGKQIGPPVFGLIGAVVGAVIPTGGWREVYQQ